MTEEEIEKKAEEYTIGLTYPKFQDNQIANMVLRDVEGAFQKGAEFGYNKANEWHYVEDGDLPKAYQKCYFIYSNCYNKDGKVDFSESSFRVRSGFYCFYYDEEGEETTDPCFYDDIIGDEIDPSEVYAWKEIVLPELKESE